MDQPSLLSSWGAQKRDPFSSWEPFGKTGREQLTQSTYMQGGRPAYFNPTWKHGWWASPETDTPTAHDSSGVRWPLHYLTHSTPPPRFGSCIDPHLHVTEEEIGLRHLPEVTQLIPGRKSQSTVSLLRQNKEGCSRHWSWKGPLGRPVHPHPPPGRSPPGSRPGGITQRPRPARCPAGPPTPSQWPLHHTHLLYCQEQDPVGSQAT